MATINGITGSQYAIGTEGYLDRSYQYATSSYEAEDRIRPDLIICPANKDEIAIALKYARSRNIAVAIRTGGHQYSGASSTNAPNIQLDLKSTFKAGDDLSYFEVDNTAFIRTSVSWSLAEFSLFLQKHHAFVPHGQCVDVHLGGHVQTGGYGQLGRSFGLLGDHVISLEIVDHEGAFKEVTKESDPELFHAILGGSPGNLCVITHFTINVYRDQDYVGSRGLKSLYWYNPKTLKRLLDILVEMSEDENFPRNYDYCVSVLSSSNKLLDYFHEIDLDIKMREHHPEIYGKDGDPYWPRMIIVYAQWVPFSPTDVCDMGWFERIRTGSLLGLKVGEKPMSMLSGDWLFRNTREFDYPYVKSTHLTDSKTLGTSGWSSWVAGRVDEIMTKDESRCWISAQFQCFGGKESKFFTNRNNGTAYSWRDSTVCATMDCFYGLGYQQIAEDWHNRNEQEAIGPNGVFCMHDRRVLWGSFDNYNLDATWRCYYEDKAKYDRLRKARRLADPHGVLTPNTFSVARH
jgi:hypothetical protein